jgi:3D-(3,5/4)-trihydroxycyclohexane-1,2-dione acylhydrolase (decyclizing)
LDGDKLPLDLAKNAESLGATVLRATTIDEFRSALAQARKNANTTVVHIETDPSVGAPDSRSWWDVPVAEVSNRATTQAALATYQADQKVQRGYLRPTTLPDGGPDSPS